MSDFYEKTKFVVLPIGKIIIIHKNGVKEYYKVVKDNSYENLNIEELQYINNIFNAPKSPIIFSEKAWDFASRNETFQIEGNEFWKMIIENIEAIIPENARDNFNRNLETLQFEKIYDNQKANVPASYNAVDNKIKISAAYMDLLKGRGIDNPSLDMMHTIIHEMIHMASSNYDKETGMINLGFDSFKDDGTRISSNRGATEGMAEVITEDILKKMFGNEVNVFDESGYKKEIQLARQLRFLVDHTALYEAYFNTEGIDGIKDIMASHIANKEDARQDIDTLFMGIEEIYDLKQFEGNDEFKTNIPALVQGKLLQIFEGKIRMDIQNNIINNLQSLQEYTGMIEKFLTTPENVRNNADKFEGIDEIPKKFGKIKDSLVQLVALKHPEQNPNVPIYSPNSGGVLERNEDGKYYSEYEDREYTVNESGELVQLEVEKNTEVSNDNSSAVSTSMPSDRFRYEDVKEVTSESKTSDVSRAYLDIKNDLANEKSHENNLVKEEKDYE